MISKNGKAGIRVYFCRNSEHAQEMQPALARLDLRDDVVLEPVPCSGRVDPRYLLKAFEGGASAVCVLACPNGDCRLMEGNLRARRRVNAVRELIAEAGLDPESVQVFLPTSRRENTLDAAVKVVSRVAGRRKRVAHEVLA